MFKTITLTQGQVALVDDDDYARLNKHKWYAHWNSKTRSFYAARSSKKSDKLDRRHIILMAREIMHAQPGQQVDHTNHDTLDNRKVNLRLCTSSENHRNRGKHKSGSSQYKGVCWEKRCGKWRANIYYKGRERHLGYFTDEVEAAQAYDKAAKKHFGEFAKLNFPNTGVSND